MGSGRYTLHVAAARDPSRRFGVARPRGMRPDRRRHPRTAQRSTRTRRLRLSQQSHARLWAREPTVLRSLRQDVDHSKHIIKSRYVFVTQLVCHYYVWGFSVELVQCYVPMFFVLASGLLGSGRVMTSLPGNYRRPLSTPTQVYRSCEVVCPADPLFPNFTNAADKPTFSDAAPLCPSSSTRRLFASWDFDDATRELDRSTGGTCWWNFDTRVSARTADASDAPPVLASGLGSGC